MVEDMLIEHALNYPWHNAVFDVRDGKVSDRTMWETNQKSHPVHIDHSTDNILINVSGATLARASIE